MTSGQNRPWGLSRLSPLPAGSPASYSSVHLDPRSQQAVYTGPGGQPIESGRHGTNKETKKKETTGSRGDGKDPSSPDEV
jgi:putative ATP-grasp target RiPP